MRHWRWATWVLLCWTFVFPAGWIWLITANAEANHLRILDVVYFIMFGSQIWLVGMVPVSLVWMLDHWLVNRKR